MKRAFRKKYSADFKAKVALEAIRERDPLGRLSSRYGVHRMLIQSWKKKALEGFPKSLASKQGKAPPDNKEELIDSLYREIGKLKVEKDWLKKKYESFNS